MNPDLVSSAEQLSTSRRDLVALAGQAGAEALAGALRSALEQRRDRAFTHLLLASLHAGHPVDAAALEAGAGLLPDAETLAAVAPRCAGDVGRALIEAVRGRRLGWDREPQALLVAELWARRQGVPRPEGLLAEARIRARREATHEGEDAIVALVGLIDDPDLSVLAEGLVAPDVKEAARALAARLVDRMVGEVLSGLPERGRREAKSRGPVRRAVAKVGRNDPCPCGSGRKYKQCHEAIDRERLAESSDVEGLTLAELQADLERHLTRERLSALRGHELFRLDPLRVPVELRGDLVDALCTWGELDAAAGAVGAWVPPGGELDEVLDDLVRLVAEHAARALRPDLTRRLVAGRGGSTEGLLLEARVVLEDDPAARLAVIEEAARLELDTRGVDLGFALMSTGLPALGVHVARAELALRARDDQTDALQATLLETRDRLLAGPWDPIEDVLYTLDRGVAPAVARELQEARAKMDRSDAALDATREALDRLKTELAAREAQREAPIVPVAPTAAPAAPARDEEAVRDLRERVERLKNELKDRHRERNALRKELDQTRDRVAELEAAPHEDEEDEAAEDEDDGPPLDASVAARLRIPAFPEGFGDRLRTVPEATARAAMMRVGELCAGFDTAFREVRPLRGFEGTWRVKIGRSYRLLFRPLDDTLEVIDLLHRQDLEKRLFRLRRGGE